MNRISNNELKKIKGGAFGAWALAGLVAACVFITGVINGIVNPKKCG